MALITDNFAQEAISFDGSGTHEVIRIDPGQNTYGTAKFCLRAQKTGVSVVLEEERAFMKGSSSASIGAAHAVPAILSGVSGGLVQLGASVDGGELVLSVNIDAGEAGEWTVDGWVLVDGVTS